MTALIACLLWLAAAAVFGADVTYAEDAPEISASSAIVMSGSTGEVIYSDHSGRKYPTAVSGSFVEAMVILDKLEDRSELQRKINISGEAAENGELFEKGEQVTTEDLLHAMLLCDSHEAATALAVHYCGSVLQCVADMNSFVQQMRLHGTSYTNLSGSYDQLQYSTAEDIALILQAALRYGEIEKIVNCSSYELKATERHEARTISNSDPLMNGDGAYVGMFGGMKGLLDGPYPAATYMGAAYVDDMEIIAVVLDAQEAALTRDVTALLNYGYKHVTKELLIKAGERAGFAKLRCGERTVVPVFTARKGYVYIPEEGSSELVDTKVRLYKGLKAPLKSGDKVGDYEIYVAGELKGTVDLIVKTDVAVGWFPSHIYISNLGATVLAVLLLLVLVLRLRAGAIHRRKKRAMEKLRREEIVRRALEEKAIEDDRARRNWTYGNFTPREGDKGLEPEWRRAELQPVAQPEIPKVEELGAPAGEETEEDRSAAAEREKRREKRRRRRRKKRKTGRKANGRDNSKE